MPAIRVATPPRHTGCGLGSLRFFLGVLFFEPLSSYVCVHAQGLAWHQPNDARDCTHFARTVLPFRVLCVCVVFGAGV